MMSKTNCTNCKYLRFGYDKTNTHMAAAKCMAASSRGKTIYWSFDGISFPDKNSMEYRNGMLDTVDNIKKRCSPYWCPLKKNKEGDVK